MKSMQVAAVSNLRIHLYHSYKEFADQVIRFCCFVAPLARGMGHSEQLLPYY